MNCDICNLAMTIEKTKMGEPIYYCKRCKLRKVEAKSAIKSNDEFDYKSALEIINNTRIDNFKTIIENIKAFFSDYKKVKGLEVGSGIGLFLQLAKEQDLNVSGIEPDYENYLAITEKNLGADCIHGMFPQDLPGNKSYDYIVFNDVYEHIPNTESVIKNISSRIKPGGLLVINIPVSTGIIYRTSEMLDKLKFDIGGALLRRLFQLDTSSPHLYYFNKKSLCKLGATNGFVLASKPLRMRTYNVQGIKKRIEYMHMNIGPLGKKILIAICTVFSPIISVLPRDTKCFFFTQTSRAPSKGQDSKPVEIRPG